MLKTKFKNFWTWSFLCFVKAQLSDNYLRIEYANMDISDTVVGGSIKGWQKIWYRHQMNCGGAMTDTV